MKDPIDRVGTLTVVWLFIAMILALLVVVGIVGCALFDTKQVINPEVYYKRDIALKVNGVPYRGVGVVPWASSYEIVITTPGKIDFLSITSCARNHDYSDIAADTGGGGLFGWFKKKKDNEFLYTFTPHAVLEGNGDCPLIIEAFEKVNGRHSWAFLAFEYPFYQLEASVACNAENLGSRPVQACQSKAGLNTFIEFDKPVQWAPVDKSCAWPTGGPQRFILAPSEGECTYTVRDVNNQYSRLFFIGYTGILDRPWDSKPEDK